MVRTALIMAGGKGERFWPKSRLSYPKQFLSLTDDGKTMIQHTVDRILPLVDYENIYIVTNKDYKELVMSQLPLIREENIICEPVGKNTAPCIGLGAMMIANKYKNDDPIMMVLPSDHLIKHNDLFIDNIKSACRVAESGKNLVTIGITPNYPETGYGYICYDTNKKCGNAFTVQSFVEKPILSVAKSYIESGNYLWNSGMFIWKTSTLLSSFKKFLNETYEKISNICKSEDFDNSLLSIFPTIDSESIDYGIMEKADNIYIIPSTFDWDDVGSWLSLSRINEIDENDNYTNGNVTLYNTKNCIIDNNLENNLIATVGLKDLIIVNTKDALLVASKESASDIKEMLSLLRIQNKNKFL